MGNCSQEPKHADNVDKGQCKGGSDDVVSDESSEAEPGTSQGTESGADAILAAEVEAAFADITDLLNDQIKSMHELQNAVQQQVLRVNTLKSIAAKKASRHFDNSQET